MKLPSFERMVEEVWEVASELCDEWEYGFLENVRRRLGLGQSLTPKQEDGLLKLYQKACRSPL